MGATRCDLSHRGAKPGGLLETAIEQSLSHLSPDHHVGDVRRAWKSALVCLKNCRPRLSCGLISPFNSSTLQRFNEFMSQHRSLKGVSTIAARRNVLKRFERVELLKKRGQWKKGSKVIGLPKTKPDV